jgi:type II secretory pathway pseudopilin PulG
MANGNRRKLELLVAVMVVGVLALFLLPALERTRVDVEEAMVQAEVAAIRVELLDRLAHHEAVGGALPDSANPLRWIERVPAPYLGELDTAPEKSGVWYFDRQLGELVYRFRVGGEARFRLMRGSGGAAAQAKLAGVGLLRVDIVK